MKKWIALALASGMMMTLVACGSKPKEPEEYEVEISGPERTSAPAPTAAPEATPAPSSQPGEIWLVEPRQDIEIVESLSEEDPAIQRPGDWHRTLSLFRFEGGTGVLDQEGKILVPASENARWCWNCGLTNEDESKIFDEIGAVIGSSGHDAMGNLMLYDPDKDVLYWDYMGLLVPCEEEEGGQHVGGVLVADVVTLTADPENGNYELDAEMVSASEPRGKMLFNPDGSKLTDVVYEAVGKNSEGIMAVQSGGKWGFLNVGTGEQLLPFQYSSVRPFHQGIAAVQTENGWTYIGTGGGARTYTGFLDAATAQDGKAWVKTEKGWGVIRLEDWPAK